MLRRTFDAIGNWFNTQRGDNQTEHGDNQSIPTAEPVAALARQPEPAYLSAVGIRPNTTAKKEVRGEYAIVIALSMLSIGCANAVILVDYNYIVPKLCLVAIIYGFGTLLGLRCNEFQLPCSKNKTAHVVALCAISGCLNVMVGKWRYSKLECAFAFGSRLAMKGMVKFNNWVDSRNRPVGPVIPTVIGVELGQIPLQSVRVIGS